jgi:eukaryotic-like serine/threonine-protein kinase
MVAKPPALPKAPPPLPLAAAELTGVQRSLPDTPQFTSEVPAAIEDSLEEDKTVAVVATVTANTDVHAAAAAAPSKPTALPPGGPPPRAPSGGGPPPSIEKTRVAALSGSSLPGVGDRIGQYIVDRVIGSGGMGLVVAARHEALNELVAIKLLRPKAAGDEVHAERFSREARAIIKIKSEHVVRVLDAGTLEGGSPYIVMEYLVGRDLAQLLRAEIRMPYPRAADLMLQVCEAVASAHAVGVVHRDLKPSNFFVTTHNDGSTVVKVLDFGIAKAVGQEGMVDPNLTETQAVFGSPTYMSPEQIRSAKHVDHRSDVWSLGVCLYELMTGKLPFAADNVAGLLASIVADPPFFPRAFVPDLPEGLEELVLHCLTKDVRQRVQSVAELAFRLAPFSSNSVETHLLIERIDRLARASGQATTTGPRLPLPPPGPVSSSNPIAILPPAAAPSTPPLPGESRSSGVTFGSTGMDLAADAAKGRQSTLAAIAIGLSLAVLILGGFGVYHFERHYGQSASPASATSTSTDPPRAPSAGPGPVASPSSAATPTSDSPPTSGAPEAAEPSAKAAAIKKITPPPPKAHPVVRPPPPAAPATTKPVDPTHDRF